MPGVSIEEARVDSTGTVVVKAVSGEASCWIPVERIITDWSAAKAELARNGIYLVSDQANKTFKQQVEDARPSGKCLAPKRPGWVDTQVYVHPNHHGQGADDDEREVLCGFAADSAFGYRGNHSGWVGALSPFLEADATLRFVMYFALTSLVLSKLTTTQENPILEIVGEQGAGKTTAALIAASMFGGSEDTGLGIGRSANMTANAVRQQLQLHNDTLLFLDETNVIDAQVRKNLMLIFDLASGEERARYGDAVRSQQARSSILLTGNRSIIESVGTYPEIREAAKTRLVTLCFDQPLFSGTIEDRSDREAAYGNVREIIKHNYGTAARKLVKYIISNESRSLKALERRRERFMEKCRLRFPSAPTRTMRTFALCYAVGKLARDAKALPKNTTTVSTDVINAFSDHLAFRERHREQSGLERFLSVISGRRSELQRVGDGPTPSRSGAWWHLKDKQVVCYLTKEAVDRWFSQNAQSVIGALLREGHLTTEGRATKKLQIKPPKLLDTKQRVYKVTILFSSAEGIFADLV